MDYKSYFQALDQLGRKAVVELRQLDERHTEMHKGYLEQRIQGDITEQGYKSLEKTLSDSRMRETSKHKAALAEIKNLFNEDIENHMMPSARLMNTEDIELLNNFTLSTSEFNSIAEKYRDNPTMGRILDDYRKKHGIDTNWRYQDLETRKEIFQSACSSVESIIGQLDKYNPDREGKITRRVFDCYHRLQGSDPDDLIAPPGETPETIGESYSGTLL